MCALWINHCVPYELILTNYISSMIHGGHTTASHGSIEVTEGLSIAFRYHVWLPEVVYIYIHMADSWNISQSCTWSQSCISGFYVAYEPLKKIIIYYEYYKHL